MAVFTDPCLFEGDSPSRTRWEHTQPRAFSSVRKSQSHSSSLLSPFHFSPYVFFFPRSFHFFFFFLKCIKECSLYRVAGVHCSYSTPMSHTHPMCLLLATLTKRGGGPDGEKEGESDREKRGEGEESEEFDMLCAWVTCIKQREGK